MDFGGCGKSFSHDFVEFRKIKIFINFLHFLDWQFVANTCKYSLNRISSKKQTNIESRQ